MKKRKLKILNFLCLTDEKYNKIREYRNQEYIRNVSLNKDIISKSEHQDYKKLLEKKENYFAYLILNDEKDYGVISFTKIGEDICTLGDYLVNDDYKYEGGGVVNRFCINYLANRLGFNYVRAMQHINNTRGNRGGGVLTIKSLGTKDNFQEYLAEIPNFNDERIKNTKARAMFDKLYEIKELNL